MRVGWALACETTRLSDACTDSQPQSDPSHLLGLLLGSGLLLLRRDQHLQTRVRAAHRGALNKARIYPTDRKPTPIPLVDSKMDPMISPIPPGASEIDG